MHSRGLEIKCGTAKKAKVTLWSVDLTEGSNSWNMHAMKVVERIFEQNSAADCD